MSDIVAVPTIIKAEPFALDDLAVKALGIEVMGIEEQDNRSLRLTEIDLRKVKLENFLKEGENFVAGEEKLIRLKASGHIRLDARFFMALLKNPHLIPEEWRGWIVDFDGTILRSRYDRRSVLYLYCDHKGDVWGYARSLEEKWDTSEPSAVLYG